MSRPVSSYRSVETVWRSIFDTSVDPEPALATLRQRYEQGQAVMEHFAGQFYHLTRHAYSAVMNDASTVPQAEFASTARHLLGDVMGVIDGPTLHPKMTDFYGVANELTPIAVAPLYLASRKDDLHHKTDLIFNDGQRIIPVQMKTDECYTIASAPADGVLVTAKDFGNEDFDVSRAAADIELSGSGRESARLVLAGRAITECIYRRSEDRLVQAKELAEKARRATGPRFKTPTAPPLLHRPFATDAMINLANSLTAAPEAS